MTVAGLAVDHGAGGTPALRLAGATMAFGGVTVLRDAAIGLGRGEIRALVGKNGSGKSTLIKILSGYHRPQPGAVLEIAGQRYAFPIRPERLRAAGLSFIHQDLGLVPEASVLDNVLVGRFAGGRVAPIGWRGERERVRRVLARFELDAPLDRPVRLLSPVERAFVAIARGFIDAEAQGGVLVLDEPTAFLPQEDVGRLFQAIRGLAASGQAILYVSHRLDEILDLTHTVTVLRDGNIVHDDVTANLTEDELVRHILGEDVRTFYPALAAAKAEPALAVDGLSGRGVADVSFALKKGEILGVSGLAGAGWETLPYLLSGATPARAGTIRTEAGRTDAAALRPDRARRLGIALLPADRQKASGAQALSLRENASLPVLGRYFRRGLMRRGAERAATAELLRSFQVRPAIPEAPLRTLSGGNQQKLLLGKWIQTKPGVLVLHEPTQGVDVGSKQDIFRKIEEIAASGVAVILASAESEDLARLCHRVLVLRRGAVAGILEGDQLSETAINDLSFRGHGAGGAAGGTQ
ncbi:sugar ABC transporter ATP-binding protein [Kaistia sp. MMO-174]|uniref:sugar ABC transporter ATP-binding protein n=1 Tax=Kaistia sp. MMO-174 TaxID=3081256 RepID=UPI00301B2F42